jgi:hypothetical protein
LNKRQYAKGAALWLSALPWCERDIKPFPQIDLSKTATRRAL